MRLTKEQKRILDDWLADQDMADREDMLFEVMGTIVDDERVTYQSEMIELSALVEDYLAKHGAPTTYEEE